MIGKLFLLYLKSCLGGRRLHREQLPTWEPWLLVNYLQMNLLPCLGMTQELWLRSCLSYDGTTSGGVSYIVPKCGTAGSLEKGQMNNQWLDVVPSKIPKKCFKPNLFLAWLMLGPVPTSRWSCLDAEKRLPWQGKTRQQLETLLLKE